MYEWLWEERHRKENEDVINLGNGIWETFQHHEQANTRVH